MTRELTPLLSSLMTYWKAARRGLRLRPERADIDPAAMPRFVLPHVLMVDVLANDFRYRFDRHRHHRQGSGAISLARRRRPRRSYGTSCQAIGRCLPSCRDDGPAHACRGARGRWSAQSLEIRGDHPAAGARSTRSISFWVRFEFERLGRGRCHRHDGGKSCRSIPKLSRRKLMPLPRGKNRGNCDSARIAVHLMGRGRTAAGRGSAEF